MGTMIVCPEDGDGAGTAGAAAAGEDTAGGAMAGGDIADTGDFAATGTGSADLTAGIAA